ncbi:MAG TPA: putative baseplate assembly protein [Symbiobacteriaceae bacterium]|jgi:hypothetical protein|nr:putative baseplate assembly protein [Symbiobacteriaceae bacterium]
MPLQSPNLDDRTYKELLAEARRLIPHYTPEWTDHNDSDPGIALLQVLAWLGEQIIYRLNRVPAKNYVEFLRLAGVQLRPATSARTLLTFRLKENQEHAWIPAGTQVEADVGGAEPVVFETEMPLHAAGAELKEVAFGREGSLALLGKPDKEMPVGTAPGGRPFFPLGSRPTPGSGLYLAFSAALPQGEEFRLHFLRPDEAPAEARETETWVGPPAAATRGSSVIEWQWWGEQFDDQGRSLGEGWWPLEGVLDTTLGFLRDGELRLVVPGQMRPRLLSDLGGAVPAYCWLRGVMRSGEYETPPSLKAALWNTASAAQYVTITEELVGRTSGDPEERLSLGYVPVVPGSLQIEVQEGDAMIPWTELPDLRAASPQDRVYTLDYRTGVITLGDGTRGRIPDAGSAVVAVSYRQGGGRVGNVRPLVLKSMRSYVAGVDAVTNPFAATGGDDEESLDAAVARAPRELKALRRAVTLEDYEAQARATPGGRIARALVLPQAHPAFPGVSYPGAVTVVVVPTADENETRPYPSRATLEEVRRHLDRMRTVTTELYVKSPVYRKVEVDAAVTVRSGYDPGTVRDRCRTALSQFLHALKGGLEGQGWPWGGPVYYGDVLSRLQRVEGVARVVDLSLSVDGVRSGAFTDVAIGPGELVYSGNHNVTVYL